MTVEARPGSDRDDSDDRPDRANRDSNVRALRRLEDGLNSIRFLLWGIFLTLVFSLAITVFVVIYSLLHPH